MRKQITEIVESFYDIGTVIAVHEIFGGYTNRSFGIDVLQDGRQKTYFMRQYKDGISVEEIRFEHALIQHAIHNGFTLGAGVVPGIHGETFVQPTHSARMFAIYEYLAGDDKYTWDNPDLTDTEFKNAGRVLAILHNAVHDFAPEGLKRMEPPIRKLWPLLADKFMQLSREKQDGELHAYFIMHLESLVNLITRNPLAPDNVVEMPVIPIHGDYHPGNLKWSNEQVVGIFDFDWAKMDLRLFDVAMALIYFCSRWDASCDGQLRVDKLALFLGAYQHQLQELAQLEPLTPGEQQLLPGMLQIANMYVLHWEVSTYKNTPGADDAEYLIYLKHNVRLMHWLEAHRAALVKSIAGALC